MNKLEYLRQFKIGGYAIFDFAVSFVGIYFLAPLLTKLFRYLKLEIPRLSWIYFTLPLSIIIHLLVGRITPMTSDFINPNGNYLLKIIIIALIIFGVKDVKIIKD